MDIRTYAVTGTEHIISPALVYYKDLIIKNTCATIAAAGSAERLWAHVKTHKMSDVVKLQQKMGITRFKCATLAEAEMLACCGAEDILVAYPLTGPNISRFTDLAGTYKASRFWAIGDDFETVSRLAAAARSAEIRVPFLVDVDIGMQRTGISLENAESFYERVEGLAGLEVLGLHCFNGNYKIADPVQRRLKVDETAPAVFSLQKRLNKKGKNCRIMVLGSTPSMPCYAEYEGIYVSPGTSFITDYGYYSLFLDLDFVPAAAILSRVISRRDPGMFTLDLGYKSIAADPKGSRGIILGFEDAESLVHCEEHWVFKLPQGREAPAIGTVLVVIPTHICPTTALYETALVAEGGKITEEWKVTARNRKITI
jgi:D-serine deaminase-like pyridoxal phosphate-dependent protein